MNDASSARRCEFNMIAARAQPWPISSKSRTRVISSPMMTPDECHAIRGTIASLSIIAEPIIRYRMPDPTCTGDPAVEWAGAHRDYVGLNQKQKLRNIWTVARTWPTRVP